jgi:hypothetical protein
VRLFAIRADAEIRQVVLTDFCKDGFIDEAKLLEVLDVLQYNWSRNTPPVALAIQEGSFV